MFILLGGISSSISVVVCVVFEYVLRVVCYACAFDSVFFCILNDLDLEYVDYLVCLGCKNISFVIYVGDLLYYDCCWLEEVFRNICVVSLFVMCVDVFFRNYVEVVGCIPFVLLRLCMIVDLIFKFVVFDFGMCLCCCGFLFFVETGPFL